LSNVDLHGAGRLQPALVRASTFAANLAGLRAFLRWAARRYGVLDPVAATDDFEVKPRGVRRADVKWLDPAGYRRWRDLGFRGPDLDGRADRLWRGRDEQRDAAFVDGLYRSGLRLTEWASVLLIRSPSHYRQLAGPPAGAAANTSEKRESCAPACRRAAAADNAACPATGAVPNGAGRCERRAGPATVPLSALGARRAMPHHSASTLATQDCCDVHHACPTFRQISPFWRPRPLVLGVNADVDVTRTTGHESAPTGATRSGGPA
jgi:hypothetical protein